MHLVKLSVLGTMNISHSFEEKVELASSSPYNSVNKLDQTGQSTVMGHRQNSCKNKQLLMYKP